MSREELLDERDVLIRSLEDLDRERDAGDLSDEDYQLLRDQYTIRTAAVLRALEVAPAAPEPRPPTSRSTSTSSTQARRPAARRVRLVAMTLGLVAVLVVSIVLLTRGTSPRLPGQTATGSVSLSEQQQTRRTLAQAEALESEGNAAGALQLYHKVLVQDPNQAEALSESGWLEYQAGVQAKNATLVTKGQADELKAEGLAPTNYAPHLYLGSMYFVEGNSKKAVSEYQAFLSESPPTSVVRSAEQIIGEAFKADGQSPPNLP